MLQCLETADRAAELLAGAQVIQGRHFGHLHGAQGFGAQRQHAAANGPLQGGMALVQGAQQGGARHKQLVQAHLRHGAAIEGGAAADLQARGISGHQEQRNALAVVNGSGGAGRHHQQPGLLAVQHQALGAIQAPAVGLGFGAAGDPVEFVVAVGFVMGQGGDQAAVDDLRQLDLLRFATGAGDGVPGQHRAAQQRFHQQPAAHGLEDQGQVEATAAVATVGFAEQGADHPHLCQLLPDPGVETLA
ncbi:hypothetical protein PBOI14_18560 [Pseudomonas sp. Boi14]|nr:hypothetical protein PBOI14_18560 [Pseudomonas sp. Boi14]